jgi:hypothetical protein
MKRFSFHFMLLAITGLLFSLSVHIKVMLSPVFVEQSPSIYHFLMIGLTLGLFILCLPTFFAIDELILKDRRHRDFWKVAFRALPSWAIFLLWTVIVYGFVLGGIQSSTRISSLTSPYIWSSWIAGVQSGQYISFYSVSGSILYTRWRS